MNVNQLSYFVRNMGNSMASVGHHLVLAAVLVHVIHDEKSVYIIALVSMASVLIVLGNLLSAKTVDRQTKKAASKRNDRTDTKSGNRSSYRKSNKKKTPKTASTTSTEVNGNA